MINHLTTKVIYQGDGKTRRFPFAFPFADVADVKVVIYDAAAERETLLAGDYFVDAKTRTVLYPGYAPGGEKLDREQPPTLSAGQKIVIYRSTPRTQMVDLGEKYPLPEVEAMPDKLTMIVQEIWEVLERCVKGGISGTKAPNVIVVEKPGSSGGAVGGKGLLTFRTMADLLQNGTKGIGVGTEFKTMGYRRPFDGGGANYIAKYLWSAAAYPWAIDLGATSETEYALVYKRDGTPEVDEKGAYVLKKDAQGKPIPVYEADGKTIKKKHLYAMITDQTVNYRQFGAVLDGAADDEQALRMCHRYQSETYTIEPLTGRKRYTVTVANHEGIIRKDNNEPIQCCGNIDLSGSELLVKDDNATWFGFYLWGDNEADYFTFEPTKEATDTWVRDNFVVNINGNESTLQQNALLFLKEDPYAVRDDGGYLYSEPRYELLLHTTDGLLTSPITYDWNNPGGLEINSVVST